MRLMFEPLESRTLLNGVTVFAHGLTLTSDTQSYLLPTAQEIANRAGTNAAVYWLKIGLDGSDNPQFSSLTRVSGDYNDSGQAVVAVDWAPVASSIFFATLDTQLSTSAAVAAVVKPVLEQAFPAVGLDQPLVESPIHLIGHSMGGVVAWYLAEDLGQDGIWVDQLTPLDSFAGVPSNVIFADNYYQQVGFPNGYSASGAHNIELGDVLDDFFNAHMDVLQYYRDTVTMSGSNSSWFSTASTGPQNAVGFAWSRIGGVARPADGLASAFGGTASRTSVAKSGTQWANISDIQITGSNTSFVNGQNIPIAFRYQDSDSGVSIQFFTDTDRNPYNGGQTSLGADQSLAAAGAVTSSTMNGVTPLGVEGTYYVGARITDGNVIRYDYCGTSFTIIAQSEVPGPQRPQDFNGDGRDDIFWRDAGGNWIVSTAQGSRSPWGKWSTAATWTDVQVADINGDHLADIVGRTTTGLWYAAISDGTKLVNRYLGTWARIQWNDVRVGDLNNDGMSDVAGRTNGGQWYAAISNGSAFTNRFMGSWSPIAWSDVRIGDFAGDENEDVVGRTASGGWWCAVSSGTTFSNKPMGAWGALAWSDVRVGDLDNNGKDDLMMRTGGKWYAATSDGNVFTTRLVASWSTAVSWYDARLADLNGDGLADLVARASTGAWYAGMSGGVLLATRYLGSWSSTFLWQDVRPLDLDGDGKFDLVGRVPGSESWYAGISNGLILTTQFWV